MIFESDNWTDHFCKKIPINVINNNNKGCHDLQTIWYMWHVRGHKVGPVLPKSVVRVVGPAGHCSDTQEAHFK